MICSECDQVKEICDTLASFKSNPRPSAYNSYDNQEIGSPFGDYSRNDHYSRHEEPTRDPDVWPPPTPVEHRYPPPHPSKKIMTLCKIWSKYDVQSLLYCVLLNITTVSTFNTTFDIVFWIFYANLKRDFRDFYFLFCSEVILVVRNQFYYVCLCFTDQGLITEGEADSQPKGQNRREAELLRVVLAPGTDGAQVSPAVGAGSRPRAKKTRKRWRGQKQCNEMNTFLNV